ncbi:MAG: RagB/SusD family nutrient uptake outer membrane protein [Candidatus Cryptobacteroides sp.]
MNIKTLINIAAAALGLSVCLSSCNFLDVIPEGKATEKDLYKTHIQADNFAASLYWYMPNRYYFQSSLEICGGDMMSGHYGAVRYFKWKSMVYDNMESPSNTYIAMWSQAAQKYPEGALTSYRMWEGMRNAYNLLANARTVPDATEEEVSRWIGEAYWAIAYLHQTLLEYYGPIIIVDHELSMNEDLNVPRSTYLECTQFISDMYDKAAEYLPESHNNTYLGRATKTLAKALKARAWLFAASPLVNGNSWYADLKNPDGTNLISQTYDKELWKKAMDAAEDAIQQGEKDGFGLYEAGTEGDLFAKGYANYRATFIGPEGSSSFFNGKEHLFSYNNQSNIAYNIKNMAPRVGYNSYNASGFRGYFVPTFDAVESYWTKNGLPWEEDPETKGLDPYALDDAKETVNMHHSREPRFYASIGYDRGEYDINGKTIILKCRRGEEQQHDGDNGHEYQTCTGYYVKKWVSKVDAYEVASKTITANKYVFPYIRFAELYLNYAEAEAEYTGTLSAKGLAYLNKIRNRAGIPNFEDSWALAGGMPAGTKLVNMIRRERMIEFMFEGRWYHDLRRWKLAGNYMAKVPKSWNLAGKTAEEFYKVTDVYLGSQTITFETPRNYWMAIPQDQININPNLVQNTGY